MTIFNTDFKDVPLRTLRELLLVLNRMTLMRDSLEEVQNLLKLDDYPSFDYDRTDPETVDMANQIMAHDEWMNPRDSQR